MWIDTHCHLDEAAFDPDRDDVLARARDEQIEAMLTIGIDVGTSRAAVELASTQDDVFAVVGVQPNYVAQVDADAKSDIVELLSRPRVVGIGETGLDRYWDYAPIELQREWFIWHLELAADRDLPFVVHCREAEADTIAVLRDFASGGTLRGIMHSFCGDEATAEAALELGLHLSFSGMVTYRKNEQLQQIAAQVPVDRLLVETDAPYLAPTPKRGKRNEPALVRHTGEAIAQVRGVEPAELAAKTTDNARALFRLPESIGSDAGQ